MLNKKIKCMALITSACMLFSNTVYAGQWNQTGNTWSYTNDNGNKVTGWNWIDGKSYYFDESGNMLTDTTTPDGYTVNSEGAWTVGGVVQTQNAGSVNEIAADNMYPLKGSHIEQWLIYNPEMGMTSWKTELYDNSLNEAVISQEPRCFSSFRNENLAAICEVANYPQIGLDYVDDTKKAQLAQELRNFLNSFDWQHASDYEKAVRIARRITRADYDADASYPYDCLVSGKASCEGYEWAAELLGTCVDLPVTSWMVGMNHVYPLFLVNGVWLGYEPTGKYDYFTIQDVYGLNPLGRLTLLGEYCQATGYVIPTDVSDKFPNNIKYILSKGENTQVVTFD